MVPRKFYIDTRDKPGLLIAVMRKFAGVGEISFEGSLGNTGLSALPGASASETAALRSTQLEPGRTDFLILSLTDDNISSIWKVVTEQEHLGHYSNIVHLQIAVGGKFVFGAYDNFHRNCVIATDAVPLELLDDLATKGVIRSYEIAANENPIMVGGGSPVPI